MKRIARFLFEIGHLKRVARSGWWVAGVRDPESVAEHSYRTIWIAYLLAQSEGVDVSRAVMMGLVHDIHEARLNDHHKVGQAYLDPKPVEGEVFRDQVDGLPSGDDLRELQAEYQAGVTSTARVARDADRIECAFQAREYINEGHQPCRPWIDNTAPALQTESGKALFNALLAADPDEWHLMLPKVP